MKLIYTIIALLFLHSFSATAQTEFEPNNTILQNSASNTFTAPVTIKAAITSSPDDRDFFRIDLPYCATWSFNLINPDGNPCILKMYLYNAQNTSNVIINSGGTTFNFNEGIPDPVAVNCGQTIYVQIDQISGSNLGDYSLQVTQNTFAGFNCNYSTSAASLVSTDTIFKERLFGFDCGGNVDVNWFKVMPASCGVLNINVTGVNSLQEVDIECYDMALKLIGNAPDVPGGANNSASVLLSGGVAYYIKISDRSGFNCGYMCNDPYDLVDDPFDVVLSLDITDACECNNRIEEACPIPINTTFNSKLWGVNYSISDTSSIPNTDLNADQDWYKVVAPACGLLEIKITGVNPVQEIKIECYDSTKTLVGTSSNVAGGQNTSLSIPLSAGEYYIRISDRYGFNCGYMCEDPYDLADDPFTMSLSFSTFNSVPLATVKKSSSYCFDGIWKNFYNPANIKNILASVNENNESLGTISVDDYVDNTTGLAGSDRYMRRHYVITSSIQPSGTKRIRLYYSTEDFSDLQTAVPYLSSASQLVITEYNGLNEDGVYNSSGGSTTFIPSSAITTGELFGQNYLEFDVTKLGEFWIHTGSFPLPLRFASFNARKDIDQVKLIWTTENETNIDHFDIERSFNGREFSLIGSKKANNQSLNKYSSVDLLSNVSKPINTVYYRIKQVDFDKAFSYSRIAKVNFDKRIDATIFPNPVKNLITVSAENLESLQLLNLNGQVMKVWKPNANKRYNVSEIPNGVYLLRLINKETIHTQKLLIQK